ncbi:hypothetical protein BGP79_01050 [Tersicoccus sp. Bi-70]|nr:hypothetical protein BGP79_01050 [Tersicoccus sp. Bi-70]
MRPPDAEPVPHAARDVAEPEITGTIDDVSSTVRTVHGVSRHVDPRHGHPPAADPLAVLVQPGASRPRRRPGPAGPEPHALKTPGRMSSPRELFTRPQR